MENHSCQGRVLAPLWVQSEGGEDGVLVTELLESPLITGHCAKPSRGRTDRTTGLQKKKLGQRESLGDVQDGLGSDCNRQTSGQSKALCPQHSARSVGVSAKLILC